MEYVQQLMEEARTERREWQARVKARRDAILAETQADWDEGKVYEAIGVTPEARAEAAEGITGLYWDNLGSGA